MHEGMIPGGLRKVAIKRRKRRMEWIKWADAIDTQV
jgi:hypothetical protein